MPQAVNFGDIWVELRVHYTVVLLLCCARKEVLRLASDTIVLV